MVDAKEEKKGNTGAHGGTRTGINGNEGVEMTAGHYIQGKDTQLLESLNTIQYELDKVKKIMQFGREVNRKYDLELYDLDHVLEIEKLTIDQTVKLKNYRKEALDNRRVVKNLHAVDLLVYKGLDTLGKQLGEKMWEIESILLPDNKRYRFQTQAVIDIFEDITGKKISDSGKYKTTHIRKLLPAEWSVTEDKAGKGTAIPGIDTGDIAPLVGRQFEAEIAKALGKKKKKKKKRKKKNV